MAARSHRPGLVLAAVLGAGFGAGCCGDDSPSGSGDTAPSTTSPATDTGHDATLLTGDPSIDDTAAADSSGSGTRDTGVVPTETEGVLSVLTYNVAGLPEPLSGSMPATYTPMISPLLLPYDLVLVQEDFAYHEELVSAVDHPYQSEHTAGGKGNPLGDGLNRLSRHPFEDHAREAWEVCNGMLDSGSDCLTMKGFSFARHELSPGVAVDVYNLHNDAGGSPEDLAARTAQVEQLVAAIADRSDGMPLIVAGDTNMGDSSEEILQDLLEGAGLVDACRALQCGEESRIDRIMLRSSDSVVLTPDSWRIDETFVTKDGEPLSDHEAVAIDLHWALQ